jgi:hypothetical protein
VLVAVDVVGLSVAHTLDRLRADGWTVKHAVEWPGYGDVDHVAVSPAGVAFAVETKTRCYEADAITRIRQQARWLAGRQRCRRRAVPLLALAERRGMEASLDGVQVVSIDRPLPALRRIDRESVAGPPPRQRELKRWDGR